MSLWKEYSLSYVKANKASTISIIAAAYITSIFLSLTCGIFYNIWTDEIRLIKLQEGDWHANIIGTLSDEDVAIMECHPNVRKVILKESEKDQYRTACLYLYHPRQVYTGLPKLVELLGLNINSTKIEYHDRLLTQYFIFAKGHNPPIIMFVYIFTLLTTSVSLIMIIHNAFGVSMMARIHQLGLLQSIGATPRQLRQVLMNEAVILCVIPVLSGVLAGTGLCYIFMMYIKNIVNSVRESELIFQYHPLILLMALAVSLLTVWISARIPARKLSRLSPLEGIRYQGEQSVSRVKHFSLASHLLGTEGELAGKSLYTRRKTFRTATISLTLSFLVFSCFLNLETISSISTRYTFFERYSNTWDLMVSVENPNGKQEELLLNIRNIPGVKNCISYQKVMAYTKVTKNMLSDELEQLGGFDNLKDAEISYEEDHYLINTPMLILDDESFYAYCLEIDVAPSLFNDSDVPNVITINTIWDNINSNRRYKKMIPFIQINEKSTLALVKESMDGKVSDTFTVNLAVLTEKLPNIREEFDNFSLMQIMPESTYHNMVKNSSDGEYYFTVLANSDNDIEKIQSTIKGLMGNQIEYTLENRIEMEKNNIDFRNLYKTVIGCLVGLLVCIGLANVLSNTLGLIYQRKRELSRYITIGLSPKGVLKILMLEATILAVKPIVIGLLVNIPLVLLSLNASLISFSEFMDQIPIIPIAIFAVVIILAVETAYYFGGRRIYKLNLVDALKDDTML